MNGAVRLPRLYAILDLELAAARGLDPAAAFEAWLTAGVRLVQLRAKTTPSGGFLDLARRLSASARAVGAMFIVNDRADIARLSGASGVHVGQDDLAPADTRGLVGPDAIVGLSTHNDEQVRRGIRAPIDYLAIGPVFQTTSKRHPDPVVGLEGVRRAASATRLPLVAIGGITLEHASAVLDAGATSLAVISDLMSGDPAERARLWLERLGGHQVS